jgi:haloacetate dehalogenase
MTTSCAMKGTGPPLLLHGWPRNHLMWRDVAPALAEDHTVVPSTHGLRHGDRRPVIAAGRSSELQGRLRRMSPNANE